MLRDCLDLYGGREFATCGASPGGYHALRASLRTLLNVSQRVRARGRPWPPTELDRLKRLTLADYVMRVSGGRV